MKKMHYFRIPAIVLAVMMLIGMIPVSGLAEDDKAASAPVSVALSSYIYDASADMTVSYSSGGKAVSGAAEMDPNKENTITVTVPDSEMLPRDTIGTVICVLPENVLTATEAVAAVQSDDVICSSTGRKLVFRWKSEAKNGFSVTIPVIPSIPAENDLSGSYVLVTATNVMVGSSTYTDKNRNKLRSIKVSEADERIIPTSDARSVWTLTHVSGDYYTVYSETAGKYLKIELPNHATLEDANELNAQKILIQGAGNGCYTFRYEGVGLNNSGNNPASGFASYTAGTADNEKFRLYDPSKVLYREVLNLSANGGTGVSDPEPIFGEEGTVVILPELNATKDGKAFIGWADVNDIYKVNPGKNHMYHDVYKPGTSYKLKAGAQTLYAVYNTASGKVQFGIRADGVIQDEPNNYDVKNYKGHFTVDGILKENRWVIDIDSTKPVNGYYIENNVTANLNWVPSAEQIAEALKKEGNIDFDPETQYVHYYVMKCTGKDVWKVDGVIRNKEKVEVTYNTNVPGTEKTNVSNMPGANQVIAGTGIRIATDRDGQAIMTPAWEGHVFIGWNAAPDGTGTSYTSGDYIRLKNNLNLYAQWADAEKEKTITLEPDWPKGMPAPSGTMITLTAKLSGFEKMVEGKDYIIQWQYATEPDHWIDIPNENGITLTYELNATTAQYNWRVVARKVE